MLKSKEISGLKYAKDFSPLERVNIIEEYLQGGISKQDLWEKHTGQREDHGRLLQWMRKFGYKVNPKNTNFENKASKFMAQTSTTQNTEKEELEDRIRLLEQALVQSELRATFLETMIDITEKELKINIRKKPNTKQSK